VMINGKALRTEGFLPAIYIAHTCDEVEPSSRAIEKIVQGD